MTFISNPSVNETSSNYGNIDSDVTVEKKVQTRELKIVTSKSTVEESPMSDRLKNAVSKNAPDMMELLKRVVERRGDAAELLQIEGNTVNANRLSSMTLHLFTLEAAKFGKTVTYEEKKTITISG